MILLNGPPGVGKSTLAQRYVDDHPLSLLLEIDAIRVSLGCWKTHDESKVLARNLALAMADAQLRTGHDVIVPQFLGRTSFIEDLEKVARRTGARFIEALAIDDEPVAVERFRARRAQLAADGRPHPQVDVSDTSLSAVIAEASARLRDVLAARPRTLVIRSTADAEAGYEQLRVLVDHASP